MCFIKDNSVLISFVYPTNIKTVYTVKAQNNQYYHKERKHLFYTVFVMFTSIVY